jgi:hypothetical protein
LVANETAFRAYYEDLYGLEVVSSWAVRQMTSPEHFLDKEGPVELVLGVHIWMLCML